MPYQKATKADVESLVPEEWGGMWFLKEPLGTERVGVTILELEPGGKGKEHEHGPDGQEEVYVAVDGEVEVDFEDETVTLEENEAVRIDPEETRQVHNRSDERVRLVLVGAPL